MGALLTQSEIYFLTGQADALFNEMARTNIIIYKEPRKTFNNLTSNVFPGYGNTSIPSNITNTVVSGQFLGQIIMPREQQAKTMVQDKFSLAYGEVQVKLKKDAADFINNGKTEIIEIEGMKWNNNLADVAVSNYLGLKYYYFKFVRTT